MFRNDFMQRAEGFATFARSLIDVHPPPAEQQTASAVHRYSRLAQTRLNVMLQRLAVEAARPVGPYIYAWTAAAFVRLPLELS